MTARSQLQPGTPTRKTQSTKSEPRPKRFEGPRRERIHQPAAAATRGGFGRIRCLRSLGCRRHLKLRDRLHSAAIDVRRQIENAEMRRLLGILDDLRDRLKNPDGYRSQDTEDAEDAFLKQRHRTMGLARLVPDPTALLVIDEADRLKIAGLEQARSIFDRGGIGMILIGMPGIEKRLARYPQLHSRIGFVHEFRPLSTSEIRQLLERHWTPPGVKLPGDAIDTVVAASIIRITGGNFRRLNRLLTQVERILEINALPSVTKEVVEAARENLVIGQA